MRTIKYTGAIVNRNRRPLQNPPYYNVIYFNEEEFWEKVNSGLEKCNVLIRTVEELKEYLKDKPEIFKEDYSVTENRYIWLLTGDTVVPDYLDIFDKTIVPLKDYKGDVIPTDGCVVKLIRIKRGNYRYIITTCNGTQQLHFNHKEGRLRITAAIMPKVAFGIGKLGKEEYRLYTENKRLDKLLKKPHPRFTEVRAISAILNPISPYFLDANKAIKSILRFRNSQTIERYVSSEKFRRIFMAEIKMLFPELAKAIRQEIPADKVAEYLKKGLDKALESETTEELRNHIDYIVQLAYQDALYLAKREIEDKMPEPLEIAQEKPKQIKGSYINELIDNEVVNERIEGNKPEFDEYDEDIEEEIL